MENRNILATWFHNPLSGVGDRLTPISHLRIDLDQVSQTGCKRYGLSSHNCQPRSFVVRYSQLSAGSAPSGSPHLPEQQPSSSQLNPDRGGEKNAQTLGMLQSTMNQLNQTELALTLKKKMIMLIGAPYPTSFRTATAQGHLNNGCYTIAYINSTLNELTEAILMEDLVTKTGDAISIDEPNTWHSIIHEAIRRHGQRFYTLRVSIGKELPALGRSLAASFSSARPSTVEATTALINSRFSTALWLHRPWDFYINADLSDRVDSNNDETVSEDRTTFSGDHVPVQLVVSEMGLTAYELSAGYAESGMMANLKIRLQDQSAPSALGSILREIHNPHEKWTFRMAEQTCYVESPD